MSTVVVVRKNGRACIAADTLTSWGSTKQSRTYLTNNSKIIEVGDTHIGVVGSAAHKLVLQSYFAKSKKHSFKSRQDIFETWRKFHKTLKDEYHLNPKDEEKDPYETSHMHVLIANPHGIFGVYSLREVDEYDKFWAFGSGTDYALGALYSLYDRLETAEEIARAAVEASAEFDNATMLPMTLFSVELVERKTVDASKIASTRQRKKSA